MATIKHYLKINTSVDRLYKALTKQNGLANWWTVQVIAQPVVNSIAEFIFGERYHNKMRILTLIKNKRVEWECLEGDKEWVGTRFCFDLEPQENYVYLRFEHSGWRTEGDFYASCNYFWGTYMTSLKNYCENGTGSPFGR